MANPIALYYWPTPNGWKVSIALEEMGLGYDVNLVNIGKGEQFAPDFLAISPNNRMPAIVDADGPDGTAISVFESGAILQYLARKTGRFLGGNAREQVEVESWLMWQMGGLGPMAGQTHHFRIYAPLMEPEADKLSYATARYTNETARLYGVLDRRLADRDFVAGPLSIADFAIWPWVAAWERQGLELGDYGHVNDWFERCGARAGFRAGHSLHLDLRVAPAGGDKTAKKALFGQK